MNVLGKIFVNGKNGWMRLCLIIVNQVSFLATMYAKENKFYILFYINKK